MEPNNIVEWKQTAPGIWTRVPDDDPPAAKKGPARKLPSLLANQLPARIVSPPARRRSVAKAARSCA